MSYGSTAPAAITNLAAGLLAAFAADPDTALVIVKDGGDLTNPDATEVVTVGYTDPENDTTAEATVHAEGASDQHDREQYDIHCAIAVLNGNGDDGGWQASRARAFDLLNKIGTWLLAHRNLNGAVMTARITSWSFRQDQSGAGALARLSFDVGIDAYQQ